MNLRVCGDRYGNSKTVKTKKGEKKTPFVMCIISSYWRMRTSTLTQEVICDRVCILAGGYYNEGGGEIKKLRIDMNRRESAIYQYGFLTAPLYS